MFDFGRFRSSAGILLPWKIDLDSLLDSDLAALAELVAGKFAFRSVYGVPRGGERFAKALNRYCEPGFPVLVVDDVLTTGRSMEEARVLLGSPDPVIGVVIVARGKCPSWVWPILRVSEWAQRRATG